MEVNRRQPKDIVTASKLNKVLRSFNYTLGIVMIFGIALLALIIFNLIYIPKQGAIIIDLKSQLQNNLTNNNKININ